MGKGGGGQSTTQNQSTTSKPPPYLEDAYKKILGMGDQVMQMPLQQYGGPMLAGFTPDQQAAFSNISGAAGSWSPYMNSASNLVNSATQPIWSQIPQYNQQNLQQYMNPYQHDVINATIDDMNRSDSLQRQDATGQAIKSGAWGGSGAEAAGNNLAYTQAKANAGTLAGLENNNFTNAQQQFMNQQGLQLGAINSQNSAALSGAGMQANMGAMNLSDILQQAAAQGNAGTAQQGLVQQQLNIPYEQFQQQQAYPYQQLQYYSNLVNGTSGGAGGTSTGTATMPGQPDNTFGNIVGAGLGMAGLFMRDGGKVSIKGVGRTKARNGGRMGYASGGIAPAILADSGGGSYIPMTGDIKASLGAPAMMDMPGAPSSSAPSLESMMLSAGGQKGMSNIGNWLGFGGSYDTPYIGTSGGPAAVDFGMMDGAPMINFRRGGVVGRTCYDGGGAVTSPEDFHPAVAGTPVYSFNPNDAAARGVVVPTGWDKIAAGQAKPAEATPTAAGNPMSLTDFTALMKADPKLSTLFGMNQMQSLHIGVNPGIAKNAYNTYMQNPGQYGFKRGGIVRRGYDSGGGVAGMPIPGYGMSMAPQMGEMSMPMPSTMPFSTPMATGVTPPSPSVPDVSKSPIPGVGGDAAPAAGAHLSAPAPMNIPAAPEAQISNQVEQARNDLAATMTGAPLSPGAAASPDASGAPGQSTATPGPVAATTDNSGGIMGHLRGAFNDPTRAAMIMAGLSMMGQHGPNASTAGVISRGIAGGISTYASMKGAQVTAAQKAEELAINAQKYADERDQKAQNLTIEQEKVDQGHYVPAGMNGVLNTKTGTTSVIDPSLGFMGGKGAIMQQAMMWADAHKNDPQYQGPDGQQKLKQDAISMTWAKGNAGRMTETDENGNLQLKAGAGDILTQESQAKSEGGAYGKGVVTFMQDSRKAAMAARDVDSKINQLQTYQQKFTTGKWSDVRGDMKARISDTANMLGISAPETDESLAPQQAFTKATSQMVLEGAKGAGERALGALSAIQAGMPHQGQSPGALKMIEASLKGKAAYDEAHYLSGADYFSDPNNKGRNADNFEAQFQKNVTPFAFQIKAMPPNELATFRTMMNKTPEGKAELAEYVKQLNWIAQAKAQGVIK